MAEGRMKRLLAGIRSLPDRVSCSVSHGLACAEISREATDHPERKAFDRDVRGPGGASKWILAVRYEPGNVIDSFDVDTDSRHVIRWIVSAVAAVRSFRIRRRPGGGWPLVDRGVVRFGESKMDPEKMHFIKGCLAAAVSRRAARDRDIQIVEFPDAGRVCSVKNLKVRFEAAEQDKEEMRHIEEFLRKIWARRARAGAAA